LDDETRTLANELMQKLCVIDDAFEGGPRVPTIRCYWFHQSPRTPLFVSYFGSSGRLPALTPEDVHNRYYFLMIVVKESIVVPSTAQTGPADLGRSRWMLSSFPRVVSCAQPYDCRKELD
jgi:hypothetical protein